MNTDLAGAQWRKSSYSSGSGGNCVEVATNLPGLVAIRDSKDLDSPALVLTTIAWRVFTAALSAE